MKKIVKNKTGVSEVVGVIIMLGIAIALFSIVYIMAINFPFNDPAPLVRITATINENYVILLHQGGESLSPDTNIIVVINGVVYTQTVALMLQEGDNSWNIGEKLLFDPGLGPLKNLEAKITVVDAITNTIIMQGSVRGG